MPNNAHSSWNLSRSSSERLGGLGTAGVYLGAAGRASRISHCGGLGASAGGLGESCGGLSAGDGTASDEAGGVEPVSVLPRPDRRGRKTRGRGGSSKIAT